MIASINTKTQPIHPLIMHMLSTQMLEIRSGIPGYLKACDENQTAKISPNILHFITGKYLRKQILSLSHLNRGAAA